MPGTDGVHDLLRQATSKMMNRQEKPIHQDSENEDHIESDTPRSGVATPVPDPTDKRFPAINSDNYFQVCADFYDGPLQTPALQSGTATPLPLHTREYFDGAFLPDNNASQPSLAAHVTAAVTKTASSSAQVGQNGELSIIAPAGQASWTIHPYPTPPQSSASSLHGARPIDVHNAGVVPVSQRLGRLTSSEQCPRKSISESLPSKARRASMLSPLLNIVTVANAHASDFSNPSEPHSFTLPDTLTHAFASGSSSHSASYEKLQKLTSNAGPPRKKSIPGTPTRALSNQTAVSSDGSDRASKTNAPAAQFMASKGLPGHTGAVRGTRGKLTVRIAEARGLRRCKDPYVVAIFQRNELVSKGPRSEDNDEEKDDNTVNSPVIAIPMSRQGSDAGRAMAIPMKSRQSSSTSLTDYRDFRRRAHGSITAPKWDTEAVFDVVTDDTHVNISVYDRGSANEDFLGQVDFHPELIDNNSTAVQGWFALQGRKDTITPSGEIYVEMEFKKSEKKHYGPEDFSILKLIGKGTFGQVYQVRKKDTKRIYAMKVLQKKVIVQKKEVAHTVGERNILVRTAMADSPFIVGLKFSFQTPTDLYLVTDYMSGGELFWHLQKEGRFDERRAKFYIAELILALEHLHAHDIVYRDLKPENILLDANGHIALCDFGLSKANLTKNDTTNTFCGTTEYLAPEVLLDEKGYTKMVDFWSLGVLVFEMCCGWSPFYAEDTQQMYKNIAFGKVRFPRDTLTTEGRNFVKGLLNRNPQHRLGATEDAQELKQHPFFADIDWDALIKKQISPPFKPKLKSETDTSNFDPEFTNALNGAGSLNARAAALAAGVPTSTPLSPGMQANFKGFTFVDESSMEEQMRYRGEDDSDDMDEDDGHGGNCAQYSHHRNRDDRMSGVQETSTNDDFDVGGHFDV